MTHFIIAFAIALLADSFSTESFVLFLLIWTILGAILTPVVVIKLLFWLDDQIQNDRRKLQEQAEKDDRARP